MSAKAAKPKPMWTRHDFARRLAVSVDTIDRWEANGTLPPATLCILTPRGRRVRRWDPDDAESWLLKKHGRNTNGNGRH